MRFEEWGEGFGDLGYLFRLAQPVLDVEFEAYTV